MNLASIPSPSNGVWHLGPVPIRAYALCIIAGVIAAVIIGERRWRARGGNKGTVTDVAALAVPFGLVGGRIYHVITSPENYFGEGGDPIKVLYIWEGGLGIYGAIFLGGVGAWFACRSRGIRLPAFADAVAPGIAVAQGIGRFGNYFNQELFGRPTNLPWGLEIDPGRDGTVPGQDTYHPTFLYEALWCFGTAAVVIWADRRFKLGRGRAFALYIGLYAAGRLWIEALRVDTANELFGVRVNIWTCLVVIAGAVLWMVTRRGPREQDVEPAADKTAGAADTSEADEKRVGKHTAAAENAATSENDLEEAPNVRSTDDPAPDDARPTRVVPEVHHEHRDVTGGPLRPTVFGAMDGLVSNFALISGVAGSSASPGTVALAGLAGLVAGAFSMAVGEYTSVASQSELARAEVDIERTELRRNPEAEQKELAEMYVQRGIDPDLARQVAAQLSKDPEQVLRVHAREELGIDPDDLPSPWTAAGASFFSFTVGAFVPLLPYLLGATSLLVSLILSVIGLFGVGAVTSRFTNRSWLYSGTRQLLLGGLAAAVTFGVGSAVGTSLG